MSSTLHVSEVFITTFEKKHDQQKTTMLTNFHILSQIEPMEETCVELVEGGH
jgi:hypothetical protein